MRTPTGRTPVRRKCQASDRIKAMRIVRAAGVALALAALCTCAQTPAQTVPAEKADLVRGSGCVRSGVEAGCLVVTATQDKKDYNLFRSEERRVGRRVRARATRR